MQRNRISVGTMDPTSPQPTVSSVHSIRNDPSTNQREWSMFEAMLNPETFSSSISTPPISIAERGQGRRVSRAMTSYFEVGPAVDQTLQSEPAAMDPDESRALEDRSLSPVPTYENESDSSDDDESASQESPDSEHKWFPFLRFLPVLTTLQRDILKCGIAYLIGSLFTFNPTLSNFIADIVPGQSSNGPSPTAHMVATVTVYFNPAKSLGAMQEADIYCLGAALFAAFVALASMDTFWFLEVREGWEWLADALTFIWIAVAMSIVAWVKLWINKPSFGPAASMTAIIIFVTVVKEGGLEVLAQVAMIVLIGSTISNLICIAIWPRSASATFENDVANSLSSCATLVKMFTRTFLLEEDLHSRHAQVLKAVKDHEATFTSLKKTRNEVRSEWWNSNIQRSSTSYDSLVDSLTRLAQHVSGLRSGLNLQRELAMKLGGYTRMSINVRDDFEVAAVQRAFGDMLDDLTPPMDALAGTCFRALKQIRSALVRNFHASNSDTPLSQHFLDEITAEIRRALFTFDRTSTHALARLLKRDHEEYRNGVDVSTLPDDDSETLCLVYFFIFTLQEFALELITLADITGYVLEQSVERPGLLSKLKLFSRFKSPLRSYRNGGMEQRPTLKRQISNLGPSHGTTAAARVKLFPPVKPHAPNTMSRPPTQSLSFLDRQKQRLWTFANSMQEPNIKLAIKTGCGTGILALPAFIDSTRDFFVKYRGEWALISFFVVNSRTIGATNKLSTHRILGTVLGAYTAAAITALFPHQPYILAIFGFLFSLPCFWVIITQPKLATSSRFVLLAYNLTCLYRYNMRADDVNIWTIALNRSGAVTVGVIWALIVSRWWWPAEARRELTRGLSELCLNMSWLYTSLLRHWPRGSNGFQTDRPAAPFSTSDLEARPLVNLEQDGQAQGVALREFMEMELHLQLHLLELQGLVAQAESEFRLKGPFPTSLYRGILTALQTILDNLHSIRMVTMREDWYEFLSGALCFVAHVSY